MEIFKLLPMLYGKFIIYVLIFTRISTLLTTFSLFRKEIVTSRILVSLSAMIAYFVLMSYQGAQIYYDLYSIQMVIQLLFQVFIGFVSAIILNIVFEVFVGVGQIASTQIGLSLASLIDPRYGYITSLTHFYMIVASLIFLFLNGHLFAIKTIVDSFAVLPLYQDIFPSHILMAIVNYAGIIFSGSVMISMTLIIILLLTNIALAVMTKFAPQFNLFTIGINMQLIIGLICIYLTFSLLVDDGRAIMQENIQIFFRLFGRLSHV